MRLFFDMNIDTPVNVPTVDEAFVKHTNYEAVSRIISSRQFFPAFIFGVSGNGKTMMVEQACAKKKREYVRVQINPETDEDDLIGGFRLVDGETVFHKGPVIHAMERGAILLIDEFDRGSNKLMCLQGILEGKPIMIKKTGELVFPKEGFNVFATANTKGKGSTSGHYSAANILDDALLERFSITLEQFFPPQTQEKKILEMHSKKFGIKNFSSESALLVSWANGIRKTYEDEGVDEVVSTRRLCHIVQTFSIFGDLRKSVELCVNRFDEFTSHAFLDLFDKLTDTVESNEGPIAGQPSFQLIPNDWP